MHDDDRDLEAWYDAETLAQLDAWEAPASGAATPLPSRVVRWSRGSAVGAVLTGLALGLQEVLGPQHDEIVVEVDAHGEPHDLPIRLLLDPDDPAGSLCIVRRDPPPPLV